MQRSRCLPLLCALLMGVPALGAEAPAPASNDARELRLYKAMPRDPLLVMAVAVADPASALEQFLETLGTFTTEAETGALMQKLQQLERGAGASLRQDVLAQLGPEIAVAIDLPPIDQLVSNLEHSSDLPSALLARVGLIAGVREPQRLERALDALGSAVGGQRDSVNGITRVRMFLPAETGRPPHLTLYYAVRDGRLVMGFGQDWVAATLTSPRVGETLVDGRDFTTVFSQLDSQPSGLIYMNLPKLRELVSSSKILGAVLAGQPDAGKFVDAVFTSELMGVGVGSTSVGVGGGVKTTSFGPPWMSGGTLASSLVAAVALPSVLRTADRGKVQTTLTDIHTIAAACEQFSGDAAGYPGPTKGWVPVATIATYLEPVYIGALPRTDAWRNPILYWSDGGTFRILSTGSDGKMDRDWSGGLEPADAANSDSDIVLGNGKLVVIPGAE